MSTFKKVIIDDGTEASPGLSFNGSKTTGLYRETGDIGGGPGDVLTATLNGSKVLELSSLSGGIARFTGSISPTGGVVTPLLIVGKVTEQIKNYGVATSVNLGDAGQVFNNFSNTAPATVTLPAVAEGVKYTILNSGTSTVTIKTTNPNTIDTDDVLSTEIVLDIQHQKINLQGYGNIWYIV